MLGKLIKHEWKAVSKPLCILHIALILMSIIGKILLSIDVLKEAEYLWGSLLMLYVLAVIALGIGTQIFLAVRFYRNMYTDEGYLSFTLPVKPWEHIFSKTLVAGIWILVDMIAIILSILILVMYRGMGTEIILEFSDLAATMSETGINVVWFMIRMIIIGILSLIGSILMYYFSISIGQLFNSHKMIASVVVYFVSVNVMQIISTIASALMMMGSSYAEEIVADAAINSVYNIILNMGIVGNLLVCVVFWFVINYIMNKRLNLE